MIIELWKRLHAWGEANAPYILQELNAGATEDELGVLQRTIAPTLPSEFLESLKIHNGEKDGHPCRVFADYGEYHSTVRIAEQWQFEKKLAKELSEAYDDYVLEVEGPMKTDLFNRMWVPFMDCNGDGYWAIDMDPAEGGTTGQVIEIWREDAAGKVIASSFESFFNTYVLELEAGEYMVEDGIPSKEH